MKKHILSQPAKPKSLFFAGRANLYQKRLLSCFLLVSFVLFLLFSILVLHLSNDRYHDELCQRSQSTIEQARNVCDTLLLDVFRYGLTSVTNDIDVQQLMYGNTFQVSDTLRAKNILADMQKYNTYVDNIYIFNFSTQNVLTKLGSVPVKAFYDTELLELINDSPVTSVPIRYYPRVGTVHNTSNGISQERVWSVIFHPSAYGAFVLNVNYSDFIELLNLRSGSKYLNSYIINGYGQVLAATDDSLFAADFSASPLLLAVKAQPDKTGSFAYTDPDTRQNYTVYYIQNAYLGLTYISTVENIFVDFSDPLFFSILGLSILFLLISAFGSILLSDLVYRPVRRLRKTLNLNGTGAEEQDEFEQFSQSYLSIQKQNDVLQTSADAWKKAKTRRMLLNWLEPSTFSQRFTSEDYASLNESFPELQYCCVLFTIEKLPGVSAEAEELQMLKYSIFNMMDELCNEQFIMRSLDYAAHQTVHLFNFAQFDRNAMLQILHTVQNVLQEHFHASVNIAVGITVADTDDLPESMKSAKQASARRFSNGSGSIVFCEDENALPMERAYPQAEETALLQAARNGEKAEAHRQLHAFFESVRPCRFENAVLYLLQLDLACQRVESATHLDEQSLDLDKLTSPSFTLDETEFLFAQRLNLIADTVLSLRESNTSKLVAKINQLVAEKLCDPNLSIAGLADEVGLSVNYLRNVYKEATGQSLSAYITAEKLKLVCEMLQTSDMTIQEISEKLGFTTRNYFFTFFKKHMGMTPKQYRLLQGNPND